MTLVQGLDLYNVWEMIIGMSASHPWVQVVQLRVRMHNDEAGSLVSIADWK